MSSLYVMPYVDGEWTTTGYVVFTDVPLDEDRDIWAVKPTAAKRPFPTSIRRSSKSGDVSPDGRWIAYDSNSPGRFEVFVNSFPTPWLPRPRVAIGGKKSALEPRWPGVVLLERERARLRAARLLERTAGGEPHDALQGELFRRRSRKL
jgi:hypothetical protein